MIINPHMNPTEIHSVNPDLVYVQVTEEDIKNGIKSAPSSCPIGLALMRQRSRALVSNVMVVEHNSLAKLPKVAQDFIQRFDRGESVIPINFVLEFKPI